MFAGVPLIDVALSALPVVCGDAVRELPWSDIATPESEHQVVAYVRSVRAIVISQDCDAARHDVTLCEVRPFADVHRPSANTTSPKKWVSVITQHSRMNQAWFYLPPDECVRFDERMGVDFEVTLRVSHEDIQQLRCSRLGRLNDVARAHFRERIAEYYRWYPYDEWYALRAEELAAYREQHGDVAAYPWQEGQTHSQS